MKKVVLLTLMIGCALFPQLHAQTDPVPKRFAIKLQTQLNADFQFGRIVSFSGISPAFQIQTAKGFLHNIEILGIGLGNSNFRNTDTRNYYLSAGYEFSVPLGIYKYNDDMKAFLGLGLTTTASSFFLSPSAANRFQQSGNFYVADIYLMPSIQRNITERFFFDFALRAYLGNVRLTNSRTADPSVPIRQRSFNQVDRRFFDFDRYLLRFGFGIRL